MWRNICAGTLKPGADGKLPPCLRQRKDDSKAANYTGSQMETAPVNVVLTELTVAELLTRWRDGAQAKAA